MRKNIIILVIVVVAFVALFIGNDFKRSNDSVDSFRSYQQGTSAKLAEQHKTIADLTTKADRTKSDYTAAISAIDEQLARIETSTAYLPTITKGILINSDTDNYATAKAQYAQLRDYYTALRFREKTNLEAEEIFDRYEASPGNSEDYIDMLNDTKIVAVTLADSDYSRPTDAKIVDLYTELIAAYTAASAATSESEYNRAINRHDTLFSELTGPVADAEKAADAKILKEIQTLITKL